MNADQSLPLISESDCNPVPVFSCHVILTKLADGGRISGRSANINGITVEGSSERDVLTAIVKRFKAIVQEHEQARTDIPWVEPADSPKEGEVERFIPVHL